MELLIARFVVQNSILWQIVLAKHVKSLMVTILMGTIVNSVILIVKHVLAQIIINV